MEEIPDVNNIPPVNEEEEEEERKSKIIITEKGEVVTDKMATADKEWQERTGGDGK